MKRKLIRFSSIAAGMAFLAVFFGAATANTPDTTAVSALDFNAGNIIDDSIFYNDSTMSVADIQAHLNRYMPACDTWGTGAVGSGRSIYGRSIPANTTRAEYARQMRAAGNTRYHEPPYICVQNFYENPTTHETLYDTKNVIKEGMVSAAQMIYDAAQDFDVNPQVLLVLLKKESYVWGDNWPLRWEYNTVMGYACPDTAPCNEKYFGFYNQIRASAWQLKYYREHINSYNYHPYATNSIKYSPDESCGRKSVYLENYATTSLYIYTPYTPNDAALRAYPGTAACGSYGNRNFFMYFSEWFGDTHGVSMSKTKIPEMNYSIATKDGSKSYDLASNEKKNGVKLIAKTDANEATSKFAFIKNSDGSYTIKNIETGFVLDVPGGGAVVGAEIQQWESNGTDAQKWYIYGSSGGNYYIASVLAPSYVLSVNSDNKVVLDIFGIDKNQVTLKPLSDERVADGKYVITSGLRDNFVIDLSGDGQANGTNIQAYTRNNTIAQQFNIIYDEKSGYYDIVSASSQKALDVAGGIVENGRNVQAFMKNGTCAQRFAIIKTDNHYTFYSSCNLGYVLDIAGGSVSNGANIQVYVSNGTPAQQWNLVDIGAEEAAKKAAEEAAAKAAEEAAKKAAEEAAKKEAEEAAAESASDTLIVAEGDYTIHTALNTSFVLDVSGGGTSNGTNIQIYQRNGTPAQTFRLKYDSARDAYEIYNPNSNRYVDLSGANTTNGSNIHIYSGNKTCAQFWKIIKAGENKYSIVSTCNEKYALDVAGGVAGYAINVWLHAKNGTPAQVWQFVKK